MCSWPQGWHSRAESPMKQERSKELVRSKTAGFLAQKKLREPSLINPPLAGFTDNKTDASPSPQSHLEIRE